MDAIGRNLGSSAQKNKVGMDNFCLYGRCLGPKLFLFLLFQSLNQTESSINMDVTRCSVGRKKSHMVEQLNSHLNIRWLASDHH